MKEEFIDLLRSTKREGIENLLAFLEKLEFIIKILNRLKLTKIEPT